MKTINILPRDDSFSTLQERLEKALVGKTNNVESRKTAENLIATCLQHERIFDRFFLKDMECVIESDEVNNTMSIGWKKKSKTNKHTDIILVTHRDLDDVPIQSRLKEIYSSAPIEQCNRVIATCQMGESASVNRNFGLDQVKSDILVMMDDDITGFYPGWLTDLIQPMIDDESIMLTSARLMNPDGTQGPMMNCGAININFPGAHDVPGCGYKNHKRVPTACIAMRKNPLRFDEGFLGSGYEDSDFMSKLNEMYPNRRIVLNNDCKLIHLNKQQNQGGKYWEHNKKRYLELRPDDKIARGQLDWTRSKSGKLVVT